MSTFTPSAAIALITEVAALSVSIPSDTRTILEVSGFLNRERAYLSADAISVAEESGTSYDFGSCILSELIESTGLRNRDMKTNPELYVLKNATMPAVLVEMGFISNRYDAELMAYSPELFAEGLYRGILQYYGLL